MTKSIWNVRLLSLAVIVTLLGVSSPARALDLKFELGGFIGAHFFSDVNGLGRYQGQTTDNALRHSANFGLRLGVELHPRVVLEGELALMPTETNKNSVSVLAFGWRGHALFNILTGRVKPFVLVGGGGFTSSSSNAGVIASDTDGELHGGVGVKVAINEYWGLRADGRIQFSRGTAGRYFTEDWEALVGAYGVFGKKKAPVVPITPAVVPPVATKTTQDSDADGTTDDIDACPTAQGPRENRGCPDKDHDGDGFVDRLDKCPDLAGIIEGCPEQDSDRDGIPDRTDKCPDKAETKNGYQDEDGCPDEVPAAVKEFTGTIEGIKFQTGSAIIAKSSNATLDKAAAVLKDNPTIKLEIGGHTDDTGSAAKNTQLSTERAQAVKFYLVKKGVADERLRAIGYGPSKPLTENNSPENRAKNRRVEFQLKSW